MCDGISALEKVQDTDHGALTTRHSSCDLLSACVALKERLPIELKFAHVKGHQDDKISLQKLSLPAQLNVLMDSIAKNMLEDHSNKEAESLQPHPSCFLQPRYNQQKYLHQDYKWELYNVIMETKVHQYWIQGKARCKHRDIGKIDWDPQYSAIKSMRTGFKGAWSIFFTQMVPYLVINMFWLMASFGTKPFEVSC